MDHDDEDSGTDDDDDDDDRRITATPRANRSRGTPATNYSRITLPSDRGSSSRRSNTTTASDSGASSGSKRRHLEQGHRHSRTSLLPHRGNMTDEEGSLLGSVPEEVVTTTGAAGGTLTK